MEPGQLGGRAVTAESLWRFYDEHAAQARQHETLRATVTSTLAAIAAAVVGLAGVGGLSCADLPAGLVVILLGLLGVALSTKHYERNRMHVKIMGEVRREIDQLRDGHTARNATQLRRAGEEEHEKEFSVFRRTQKGGQAPDAGGRAVDGASSVSQRVSVVCRTRLHLLWLGLPAGIGLVGILVVCLSIVGVAPGR